MRDRFRAVLATLLLVGMAQTAPITGADTVIGAAGVQLLEAGEFSDPDLWEISSTSGFSQDMAEYSIGMIADDELSFTHNRPDNFAEITSWATYSSTGSNYTLGEPDTFYTWSKGPNISMQGYDFSGLHGMLVSNVSMVLHFSIPDVLNQDSVRVVLKNHGTDKLVTTYARTLGPVHRISNPMVLSLDGMISQDWNDLENTRFTIDYVSNNVGSDDSEVRVDAVGLRVKYHQPWYSFETVKAVTTVLDANSPVLDFGPYDGETTGLGAESCGLTPTSPAAGSWSFDVEVPPLQQLGRIHVYGSGNHTIWTLPEDIDGDYIQKQSGDLLENRDSAQQIIIEVNDGCISGARVDVNDPRLIVSGMVSGNTLGLADTSYIRFAIGNNLATSIALDKGEFAIDVPVGHALPGFGGELQVGVASRFQWSSNGTEETTVVHIEEMSISGSFEIHWDYDPECLELEDMSFNEDDPGVHLPMDSRCQDDNTSPGELSISAMSSDSEVIEASIVDQYVRVQPVGDAWGSSTVFVEVMDYLGNTWSDSFSIVVNPVNDPPLMEGLPVTVYIELGETMVIDLDVFDVDSESLELQASRSWATFDSTNDLVMTPVSKGNHIVEVTLSDGELSVSQSIEVIVTAKSDLAIEMVEIWKDGARVSEVTHGDVVEVHSHVRNLGRETADAVDLKCWVDDVLIGSVMIDSIAPGELGIAICDAQVPSIGSEVSFYVFADATDSIDESSEDNNGGSVFVPISDSEEGDGVIDSIERGPAIFFLAIGLVLISLTALYFGPGRVNKPFERRK
ncbi:MAG TPA: hypothetical protein D7H75_00720 [Candidatus Poseidoniales archaeon]|nr:MAG TPA: hypothetical protein D7H75_00720 [Candidatus Poseidoniales archaeon]HIH55764.1 hypothetical protein [Candidatus Thalassarchaeum sp.]